MNKSIMKVSKDRWEGAQEWELKIWRREENFFVKTFKRTLRLLGRNVTLAGDDWNHWWQHQFEQYQFIPQQLENVIELGCGPYTNVRLIRNGRQIKHLVCSDPLANDYLQLKQCWLSQEHRKGMIMVDSHPAEATPFASDYFDLVVMINVLDHVQDAVNALENAVSLVKSGGILVFGQDLTNAQDIERIDSVSGEDVGHPIRLHHDDLYPFFSGKFVPLVEKVLPRGDGRAPQTHYGTLIYAGKRV